MSGVTPCGGVVSNRQLLGKEFPLGGEWDAGVTPPLFPTVPAGRWTVRCEPERFIVIFHSFSAGQETLLETFPSTEKGELDAKACALSARDAL
jgi:hypothetical protein